MQPLSAASEEQLVAELETLGVHYHTRQDSVQVARARSAQCLLADLVRQPTSRLRMALISLLLAHPNFGQAAPASLPALTKEQRSQLKLLYTAARLLQKEHAERLQSFLGNEWSWLPDWFSAELNLPPGTPQEQLQTLAPAAADGHDYQLGRYLRERHPPPSSPLGAGEGMEPVTAASLDTFLQKLGQRIHQPATLYLLGGNALYLLGNLRKTLDVDYSLEPSTLEIEKLSMTWQPN